VLFVELARQEEYVTHGKAHLLPGEPATILSRCENCDISLLKKRGRPLYKISRKRAMFGPIPIKPDHITFSNNPISTINRKYYVGENKFLKVFRFTERQKSKQFNQEVRALSEMAGSALAPEIIDWTSTRNYAAVLEEQVAGKILTSVYERFQASDSLKKFICRYLEIADRLAAAGLYHNDLSGHNLLVRDDGRLCAIDFEQTDAASFIDPFAVMLWTLFDIKTDQKASYDRGVYQKLYDPRGISRADKAHYPEFSRLNLDSWLAEFIARSEKSPSWFEFVRQELERFGGKPAPRRGQPRFELTADINPINQGSAALGSVSPVPEIVRAAFRATLDRPPGPGGLEAYSELFENVPVAMGVERAIRGLLRSEEFQQKRPPAVDPATGSDANS
jgi:predicted Ser/Thr protein kinase